MEVYLGKYRKWVTTDMTGTHAAVKQLTRKVKGCGHKLYTDNNFSFPDLYNSLTEKKINCRSTVRPNCEGIPDDFRNKTMKRSDTGVRMSGDMTAVVRKEKRDVHTLTNIRDPPEEGKFCDESGNALRPAIAEDYSGHMGYIDESDRMANSYSISHCM